MVLIQQGDEVGIAVRYLRQVILVHEHGVAIGIGQGERVLEVTSDVLCLESISIHDLLVERAVRKLVDRLTIRIWSLTV